MLGGLKPWRSGSSPSCNPCPPCATWQTKGSARVHTECGRHEGSRQAQGLGVTCARGWRPGTGRAWAESPEQRLARRLGGCLPTQPRFLGHKSVVQASPGQSKRESWRRCFARLPGPGAGALGRAHRRLSRASGAAASGLRSSAQPKGRVCVRAACWGASKGPRIIFRPNTQPLSFPNVAGLSPSAMSILGPKSPAWCERLPSS